MSQTIQAGATDVSTVIRIIDSTDGTPETGVEHNTTGIDLWYRRDVDPGSTPLGLVSITEVALASLTTAHSDGGIEHIGDGYYRLDLPDAACATGAIGVMVAGTVTGMVVIGNYIQLVDYDPQDAVRLGLTALPNAAADAAGGLPISDAGGLDMDGLAASTADAVWDETQSSHTTAGSFGEVATEIANILTDTNELQTDDVPGLIAALNDLSAAQVNAEVDTALSDIHLDHLLAADYDPASKPGVATALMNELVESDAGVSRFTANALEQSPAAPTAATVADAVWDEAQADHTSAGTFGETATEIASILTDTAEIGSAGAGLTAVPWNAAWDAEVQSEVNDGLVALGLDHIMSTSVAGTDVADDSVVAQFVSASATADWDDFDNATDSLEALRNRGDAAWTTGAGGTPPQLLQSTTIATLASQTSFTLTAGSADNDAYNDAIAVVTDQSTSTQKAVGLVSDYVGSTRTVTLDTDPGIFTMAVGDTIEIIAALGSSSGGGATAGAIADAVWDEAQSGHSTAGTFGELATEIADILADTNELQTDDVPGTLATLATSSALATVDTNVDAILVDTGTTLPATLTTIEGKIDTVDTVVDSILADTAEIGAAGSGLTEAGGTGDHLTAIDLPDQTMNITGNITGNLSGSVGSVTGNVGGIAGTLNTLDDLDTAQDTQHSTTQSAITTVDTVVDAIKVITDAIGATAAANLARTLGSAGTVFFTAQTGTLSTTVATTDLSEATDDHYNGRVIVWLTGVLAGQATDITDYSGTNGTLTYTATTEAPSNGDTGIIV